MANPFQLPQLILFGVERLLISLYGNAYIIIGICLGIASLKDISKNQMKQY
jgi:hypothetical protein